MTAAEESRPRVTPGQTVGPFFGFALPGPGGEHLVPGHHPEAIRLHGTVYDGHDDPVPDALLEIWQTDSTGVSRPRPGSLKRDGYTFTGWGRAATDNLGHYGFTTVPPTRPEPDRAPFIAMTVFARGLLDCLFTRVYLPWSPALAADPFLRSVAADRRATLIARPDQSSGLRFDVHLQGERETVFLDFGILDSGTGPTPSTNRTS